jgi:hypothetical protein
MTSSCCGLSTAWNSLGTSLKTQWIKITIILFKN